MKKLIILLAMGMFAFNISKAQTTTSPDTATSNFITQATMGGLMEVKAGKLALTKAKNANVKAFAARMVADHTKANNQLKALVKSKGYTMPSPSVNDVADPMLTSSTGANFDKNYVTMMVQDHKKTVQLFENASTKVTDPDIKAFINQTLPVIRQHLTSIQAIASQMGINNQ